MREVVLYLKRADPYSVRLRTLLERKGVSFSERFLSDEELEHEAFSALPQLVVDGRPVGTFEEVGSLDLRGELDAVLR